MEEVECKISGRVQLVMFRDFAKREAKKLGLLGWVKNLGDGRVELIAQGEKESLDKYLELLNKGPVLAKVESIDVSWRKPVEVFSSFEIRY